MYAYSHGPVFCPGERVISIVYHPPEIRPGTEAVIVSPREGPLYAVQTEDGELHRWFAGFELEPVNRRYNHNRSLRFGDWARVITSTGHHHVQVGSIVRIAKVITKTPFYDVMIHGEYHRWLAEFEIARPLSNRPTHW